MLRAAHWWIQANGQSCGRIGYLFICFDGNFDVVASKKSVRIRVPAGEEGGAGASVAMQSLDDGDDEVLPPESDGENKDDDIVQEKETWVTVIIATDRKHIKDGRIVTGEVWRWSKSPVPTFDNAH